MRLPAFQTFIDAHREHVYRFLVAAAGPDDADDCFQETFIAALRAYPRLRNGSDLRAWVLTIAHRKALDSHRSRRRRPTPVADVPDIAGAEPVAGPDDSLWSRVRQLPPKQRAAVLCRFVNDLPYAEVARIVGCSEEAARQNVREGLRKLKERI